MLRETLERRGRAHFEYAQREPVRRTLAAARRGDPARAGSGLPCGACSSPTRRGGVASGPYASLNLRPGDRRRPGRASRPTAPLAVQPAVAPRLRAGPPGPRHRVRASRAADDADVARRRRRRRRDAPDVAAIVLVADCLPVALVAPAAVAMLHAGWRGLGGRHPRGGRARRCGSWRRRRDPRRDRARRAASAATRPATRSTPRSRDSARGGRNADLKAVARARLQAAGRGARSTTSGSARSATASASSPTAATAAHGPPGGGRVAELIRGLDAARRASRERPRATVARARSATRPASRSSPPSSTSRSRSSAALAEAGHARSSGRTAPRSSWRKAAAHPRASTWDFIGQLQSRKVKQVLPLVRWIHSVASDSALEQLGRHGTPETEVLVEVNIAGEEGKERRRARPSCRASSRAARCASSA